MKRQITITLGFAAALLITFAAATLISKQNKKTDIQTIKIGANLTLSGPIAYWGEQVQKGLTIAATQANQDSSQTPVEILYQDNQGEAKNAISIFQRFVSVEGVTAMISIFTPVSSPLRSLSESYETPLLATVVSAVGFGLENEWSFRDFPSQSHQATAVAQHAINQMMTTRAATLVVNDDYGRDGETVFRETFTQLGGTVVASETMEQRAIDVRAQLTKLLASDPQALFIVVRDNALGIAVKQARELGFHGEIIGVNAFDAPVVWEAAGAAGEGVVFTSAFIDYEAKEEAQTFLEEYRRVYNESPDWVAVYGYTIGTYLVQMARDVEGDQAAMRAKLAGLDADSIRGRLRMNESRDVLSPIGIYKREGGQNILLEKINPKG